MTRRSKRVLIAISATFAVILAIAACAVLAGPGWLRGTVERVAGVALGRELKIAGAFDLSLSPTASLAASDITLSNVAWGSEPTMVHAGRIAISVELRSLWSGPVRVRDLAIEDVRVLLEKESDGRANWQFATKPRAAPAEPGARPRVIVERASVRGFELIYRPPGAAPAVTLGIDAFDATVDPATQMIDIRGGGHFNDAPWDLAGRIGPIERLFEGQDLDQALTGHVGRASLSLSGRIHDLRTLGGPNVEIGVDGPDIGAALANLGFRSPVTGPFSARVTLAPAGDDVALDVDASAGGVTATVRGTVNAILSPDRLDAAVKAAGPDASEIGAWTGVKGLPKYPFDLAGRVRVKGPRLTFDDLRLRVGGTSLTVGGTLGELPRCVGADLNVAGTGSDLAQLRALTRVQLPEGAFDVRGRFLIRADGLAIEDTTVNVRGAVIHAAGTIGQPPGCKNLSLTTDAVGPDASWLSGIATIELPAKPFELRGSVAWNGTALDLQEVSGRLGGDTFGINGLLVPVRGLAGTDAHVRVAGADLREAAAYAGLHDLPAEPFDAVGRVTIAADRINLDDVEARVGGLTAAVDGEVGAPSPLHGTSLTCRARGAALSDLSAWGVPAKLPSDPFAASGHLRIEHGMYHLDDVTAEIGPDRLAVDGTLGALPDVRALDVTVDASGPDLAGLGRFLTAAGTEPPARVPAQPFHVTGRALRVSAGVELHDAKATVGEVTLSADGLLGTGDRGLGTDLTFEAAAPDTWMLSSLIDKELPEGPLRAHGRFRRSSEGSRFDATEVSIGASFAQVSGVIGAPPKFARTDLEVNVEGPDFAAIVGPLTGLAPLPADSFAIAAHVHGSTESFTSDRFTARLGDTDVEGRIALRLSGKPFIDADVRSKHIDIPRLVSGFTAEPEVDDKAPAAPKPTSKKRDLLISNQSLALGTLQKVDGHVRLAAAEVLFPGVPLRDVEIQGDLRDGALRIDRFQGTGTNGGHATGALLVQPKGDSYWIHAEGRLEGGRLDLSRTGQPASEAPSLDIEYAIDGTGRSLHEIAAGADGHILLMLGPGRIPNSLGDFMTAGVLTALLDAMNPLRKTAKYTNLECGIAAAGIDDGKMAVQPIAARSDKLTAVGTGKLDLATEKIDLTWTIKPRRGVGLSGASIANPYIKLGGTLASPSIDIKPVEAVVSTGAAVATLGLTVLFRGVYDRITAEKKVCVEALAKARKQMDAREARKSAATGE